MWGSMRLAAPMEKAAVALYIFVAFKAAFARGWFNVEAYFFTLSCIAVTINMVALIHAIHVGKDTILYWYVSLSTFAGLVSLIVLIFRLQSDPQVVIEFTGMVIAIVVMVAMFTLRVSHK